MDHDAEEGTPFIHSPNLMDDDPKKNGLVCFLDKARPCGADCMAFISNAEPSAHIGPQASQCLLLVSAEKLTRHVIIVAKLGSDALSLTKKKTQDEKRESQVSPTSPVPVKVGP